MKSKKHALRHPSGTRIGARLKTKKTVSRKPFSFLKRKEVRIPKKKRSSESDIHKTKIRLIGVGGGGGSIVSEIAFRMKKADFVVANTDSQALKKVAKKVKRFQFGQDLTQGLGTGMNVEIGEQAAQNEKEKIKKLFENQDVCIIVASLGGGTGSGAVPIFAKIANKLDCLTYGIFTLPFEFEGEKKMEIAKESLRRIKSHLNAYSVIPNERIFQIINKDIPLKNALSAINQKLAENLEGLIEMIYLPGLVNIDFADLRTILAGKARLAYLNTVTVEAPNKPAHNASHSDAGEEEAVKKVISSSLYPYTIKGAKGILYNISSDKTLQLSEVSQISKIISESIHKKAKIIFGINQNPKLQHKIKITLLAVGCGLKGVLLKPSPEKIEKKNKKYPVPKRAKIKTKTKIKVKPLSIFLKKAKGKPSTIFHSVKRKDRKKKRNRLKIKKPEKKNKENPLEVTKINPVRDSKSKEGIQNKHISNGVKRKPKKQPLDYNRYSQELGNEKVRRSGLQVKEAVEREEKKILEREKIWETPAIFRKKNK